MKTKSAQEVLQYIANLNQSNWWFVGQRKWSVALAYNILKHEARLRRSADANKPDPAELGLVFLKDISQVDEALITDCNRIYIFNHTTQLHIIPSEDAKNAFYLAETKDCCVKMEKIDCIHIKAAKEQNKPHPFLFASLLGSIPDCHIIVKHCCEHNTWRFYHE
ncbi:hypothetical protein MASR1M36_00630 [Candidatus Cloacimonadaceae bacterium]